MVQDDEFADIVENSLGIDQVSQNLVNLAIQRETDDNVSVVAVHIRELKPAMGIISRLGQGKLALQPEEKIK